MNWRDITSIYREKFKESAGVPFDGFPNEEIEKEYLQTLQNCIEIGKPMTLTQRKYFFPLEYENAEII